MSPSGVRWHSGELWDNVFQMPRLAQGSGCVWRGVLQGCISISGKPWGGYPGALWLVPACWHHPSPDRNQLRNQPLPVFWPGKVPVAPTAPLVGLETIFTASRKGLIEAHAPAAV